MLSAVLAGGALVALAVPALSMKMDVAGPETLPRDIAIVKTYDRVQEAFPGDQIPADVVIETTDVRVAAGSAGDLLAARAGAGHRGAVGR